MFSRYSKAGDVQDVEERCDVDDAVEEDATAFKTVVPRAHNFPSSVARMEIGQ